MQRGKKKARVKDLITWREKFIFWLAKLLRIDTVKPALRLLEIDDNPHKCYVWLVNPEIERDTLDLTNWIREMYIAHYHREPQALHMVLRSVTDIREFSKREVRLLLKPWLEKE